MPIDPMRGTGDVPEPSDLHVRSLEVRDLRAEKREADFIASTDAIDSYGEIVEQSWDLKRYERNPVILWAHQSRELPIGQATKIAVKDGQLTTTVRFASEKANPKAEQVWQGVQEGTIRAVSVGFHPRSVRTERREDKDVYVLGDNELFEISVTPIPANPEALARQIRARAHSNHSPPAERGGDSHTQETLSMDELTKARAALDEASKALDAEKARVTALETQNAHLAAERDAANVARELAESKLIEAEVSSLVGVKISKDEAESFCKLARLDRKLFDSMVAQRSPLPAARDLNGAGPVVGAEPPGAAVARADVTDDTGASLEAEIQKALAAS